MSKDVKMNRITRTTRRAGFTLIEVLLVIVIIAMLAGVLAVTIGNTQEDAEVDTTKLKLDKLEAAIQRYRLDMKHYPTEEEGGLEALVTAPATADDGDAADRWRGAYVKEDQLVDAWGNQFTYEPAEPGLDDTGPEYRLWSNGPDGESGTDDDIRNWSEDEGL
jgi:general secretion pathway protein G